MGNIAASYMAITGSKPAHDASHLKLDTHGHVVRHPEAPAARREADNTKKIYDHTNPVGAPTGWVTVGGHKVMLGKAQPQSLEQRMVAEMRVQREAHKAAPVAANAGAEQPTLSFKAAFVDSHGVIVGIGGASGSPMKLDLDNEFLTDYDLAKMAFDFNAKADRRFLANHDPNVPVPAELVESWVGAPIYTTPDNPTPRTLKADEALTDQMTVTGIDISPGNMSHWFVGIRPQDPAIVEAAKAGDLAGFSWSGYVNRTTV